MTKRSPDCRQVTSVTISLSGSCSICYGTHVVIKWQNLHVYTCVIQMQAHAGTCTHTQVRNTCTHRHIHGVHTDTTQKVLYWELFSSSPPAGTLTELVFRAEKGVVVVGCVIAAGWLHHTDGLGPVHMLTEHNTSLSTSLCRALTECTEAPSGILMIPIQFVEAKATSWMSSVDTSL